MVVNKPAATYFKRYEQKYILNHSQYNEIAGPLGDFAREDEFGLSTIYSIYYDSDDFRLTRNSMGNSAFKEKLRVRSYGIPAPGDTVYWELKKKLHGLTYKQRIPVVFDEFGRFLDIGAINGTGNYTYRELKWLAETYKPVPQFMVCYERRAFQGIEDDRLRVTFDTNILWRNEALDFSKGFSGSPLRGENEYIMELKTCGAVPFELSRHLTRLKIFPVVFSKFKTAYLHYFYKEKEYRYA
jgi:SPX domain protein involved in polyphosphate accumulation